jgi:hypothetical protein
LITCDPAKKSGDLTLHAGRESPQDLLITPGLRPPFLQGVSRLQRPHMTDVNRADSANKKQLEYTPDAYQVKGANRAPAERIIFVQSLRCWRSSFLQRFAAAVVASHRFFCFVAFLVCRCMLHFQSKHRPHLLHRHLGHQCLEVLPTGQLCGVGESSVCRAPDGAASPYPHRKRVGA